MVGASIVATGDTLAILALGRVVSGVGSVTFFVVAPQLLAQWFAGREIGVAMGTFNTGVLGAILSMSVLTILAENHGWRASIWLSVAGPGLALIVFALFYKSAPKHQPTPSLSLVSLFKGIGTVGKPIWLIGVAWGLYNAAIISMLTFTPDFLAEAGFSVARAGFITSLALFPVLLSPVAGFLIDRAGYKKTIFIISGLGRMGLLALMPYFIGWVTGLILLLGVFNILIPVVAYALVPDVTRPEKLGMGFGIISICFNVGILVGPATSGWIKDATISYHGSYLLMAGFALLMALVVGVLAVILRTSNATKP